MGVWDFTPDNPWIKPASRAGSGVVPFDIDGTPQTANDPNTASIQVTLSSTYPNGLVVIGIVTNAFGVDTITDTAGLTYTQRGDNSPQFDCMYTAPAPSPLSGNVITITFNSSDFTSVVACVVSGADTASPVDPNGSLPATGSYPLSVDTTNPDDVVFALYRGSSPDPTAGTGFDLVGSPSGGFCLLECKFVTSPQTGLSCAANDAGSGVATAFKKAP